MATVVDMRENKLREGFVAAEPVDFQAGHNIYVRDQKATVVDTDYPLIYYVFEGQEEVKHRSFAATPYQFSVSQADRELHATEAAEEDDEDNDSDSTSAHPGDSDDGNSSDEDPSDRYRNAANAANNATPVSDAEEKNSAEATNADASGDDVESGVATMPHPKQAADSVLSHIKNRPPNFEFRNTVGGEHSTDVTFPQAVRFSECKEAIFEVKNKVAQVELDKCVDITVKLASVISSVEISNANDCRIECSGKCNSFVIEKSIGCEIQLVDSGDDVIIVSTKTDDTTVQITAGPDSVNSPPAATEPSAAADSSEEAKSATSTELKSEAISSFPVTYIIKEDTSDLPAPTPSEPGFERVNDIPQFITKYDAAARKISTSLMKRDARGAIENLN